jgi:hypothetical protein
VRHPCRRTRRFVLAAERYGRRETQFDVLEGGTREATCRPNGAFKYMITMRL